MDELDRVFQRDDVLLLRRVDQIDHGGQRGRLARAGRPRHQDQAVLPERQRLHHLGETELLEGADLSRDDPEDGALAVPLVEDVDAEPRVLSDLDREVQVSLLLEYPPLIVVEDLVDHLVDLVPAEGAVLDGSELAVEPHERQRSGGQVEVGPSTILGQYQQLGDVHGSLRSINSRRNAGVRGTASTVRLSPRRCTSTTPRVRASNGPRRSIVAR